MLTHFVNKLLTTSVGGGVIRVSKKSKKGKKDKKGKKGKKGKK
jgi:hypothetical protein